MYLTSLANVLIPYQRSPAAFKLSGTAKAKAHTVLNIIFGAISAVIIMSATKTQETVRAEIIR